MSSRRRFVKKIGAAAAGLILGNRSYSATVTQPQVFSQQTFEQDPIKFWELVRSSFHIDENLTYLNNGTLGPSPAIVEHTISEKITQINSNLRYGGGEECRESLAKLMGCKKEEICITHNTTEGLNIAAWGLPLKKGDEVLMTTHEHVGNAMPWINRMHLDGIKLQTFKPAGTQNEILGQIARLINKRTRVITVPHVSCTIGQQFPVKEICKLAREKGIYSVIDGAHGVGALKLNMKDIDADVYASCGHKWLLGPQGTGMAYIPERMFDVLTPVFAGAYSDDGYDITVNPPTFNGYSKTAHRYDYGTQSSAFKYGIHAAANFHLEIGLDKIENRVLELNEYLYQKLLDIDSIELLSSTEKESRSMMLGFKHKVMSYEEVANKLWRRRYRVRQVPEAKVNGVRVSTHMYNTFAQLDGFVSALKAL
ncbi:MAG: aminotransferase class V-fold PLP-dependent enzyme [Bacteroidia bacterium]